MIASARPVCVVGTGRNGTAAMLGLIELGFRVHGCDVSAARLDRLQPQVREHSVDGRLRLFDRIDTAAAGTCVAIVAVDTHVRSDGSTDSADVGAAIRALAGVRFTDWPTIVIRSSVAPGTSDTLAHEVREWADLIYAPVIQSDTCALAAFLNPDRIIIGCDADAQCIPYVNLLQAIDRPIFLTSRRNAELIECCSGAYRALSASFASVVGTVCEAFGAATDDVLRGIAYARECDDRLLRPGMTLDSPSLDRDMRRLQRAIVQRGLKEDLFSAALRISEDQPQQIVTRLEDAIGPVAGRSIGIWGLTASGSSDDAREGLAFRVIELLAARQARTIVYDPALRVAALPSGSRLAASALEAARADALVVLSGGADFYGIDPAHYAGTVASSVVVDAGNILDPDRVQANGMRYHGIGRSRGAHYAPSHATSGRGL